MSKLILIFAFFIFSSGVNAGWFTGSVSEILIDFRGGDPSVVGSGQLAILGKDLSGDTKYYNLQWIKTTYPEWWPYVYGLITAAHTKKTQVQIEFNDTDFQIRYIKLYEPTTTTTNT